jgi:hypothetical protein
MSCFRLCVRDMVCSSEFLLTQALLSPLQCRSTGEDPPRSNSEMLIYFEIEEALDRIVVENVATEEELIHRERRMGIKHVVDVKNKLGVVE